jgi:UDP-N-acetylglucosamine 4,6-dehydratase
MKKNSDISLDSTFLITGGTGSFGSTMVRALLDLGIRNIRVLSRDENKQDTMRKELDTDNVSFYIGDVRSDSSLDRAFRGVDYVFHAAALKQVPSCEFFPEEAVETNIRGSQNVIRKSILYEVKKVVFLSTDKAVYPINAMGMSKALMEKHVFAASRENNTLRTKFMVTRYGNVMFSRGSVLPHFMDQLKKFNKITVTNTKMTRFLLSLQDSIDLVLHAFKQGESGDLFVKKAPAATVETLGQAMAELLNISHYATEEIGIRHGEKMHESLLSKEEFSRVVETDQFFKLSLDDRTLQYKKYHSQGNPSLIIENEYSSENTERLSVEETKKLLKNNKEFNLLHK